MLLFCIYERYLANNEKKRSQIYKEYTFTVFTGLSVKKTFCQFTKTEILHIWYKSSEFANICYQTGNMDPS